MGNLRLDFCRFETFKQVYSRIIVDGCCFSSIYRPCAFQTSYASHPFQHTEPQYFPITFSIHLCPSFQINLEGESYCCNCYSASLNSLGCFSQYQFQFRHSLFGCHTLRLMKMVVFLTTVFIWSLWFITAVLGTVFAQQTNQTSTMTFSATYTFTWTTTSTTTLSTSTSTTTLSTSTKSSPSSFPVYTAIEMRAFKPDSMIHLQPLNANGLTFQLGVNPTAYCPFQGQEDAALCPPGNVTGINECSMESSLDGNVWLLLTRHSQPKSLVVSESTFPQTAVFATQQLIPAICHQALSNVL